ncbi:MAG: 6-hydroxymethylpterin diphosphokinase MptE-like protein [Planctomycetota bacterium]|jgi:hypothetical protein
MSPTTIHSALSANLAALGERHADLARRLRDIEPDPQVTFRPTPQDVPAADRAGRPLCSRHRPLDEGRRLADGIDVVENATVVVVGFGLGYHVRALAERLDRTGVIIVFEPDLPLLRAALERVDHAAWLAGAPVVFVTDPADRGALGTALTGLEPILAQGVAFLDHPASRARLAEPAGLFRATFADFVDTAKTTFSTTLMRSVDTIRNCMGNLEHYVGGDGVAPLAGAAAGCPAVVVSAGPSLERNLRELAAPGVRDRCVIIAVQTVLKPMLAAGVRPHFVTALDYHEISRRFYEDLDADAVRDVTLVAEPKAHPVILESFPGGIRCCASPFLDELLGDVADDRGTLPPGATVAHLAFYLAEHLGCDPIAMIGQDLAFPDGLYYAPGTAIDDVWAPELNPFNTIEMMQWQRIVRHRLHLHRVTDASGRPVYTDAQMRTYQQQFERDFAAAAGRGRTIIDATEGGVPKQHAPRRTLADVLRRHAVRPVPPLPAPARAPDAGRLEAAARRLRRVRGDVRAVGAAARRTHGLLGRMLDDQRDAAAMERHFARLAGEQREVERRMESLALLNQLNQLGVFRRMKADRRLQLAGDLDPLARQRAELERDRENVAWIRDASEELVAQLDDAMNRLAGRPARPRRRPRTPGRPSETAGAATVAALVPVDPDRGMLGDARALDEPFAGRPVLQATLERLGAARRLDSIVLLADRAHADRVEAMIDRAAIDRPVHVAACDGDPFGPERRVVAAARRWSETCWRGGVGGVSVFDEVLCPGPMAAVMRERGLTAAVLAGPDWPLVDPALVDAVVERHLEQPDVHHLVFTQAPPGLGGCLVDLPLMEELSLRNRLCTAGALLVYQPHAPQHDPVAREANVQVDHRLRRALVRATFDSPRRRGLLRRAVEPRLAAGAGPTALEIAETLAADDDPWTRWPQHVVLELGTDRPGRGPFRDPIPGARVDLDPDLARALFEQLTAPGDVALTLDGAGDPLAHPRFEEIVAAARAAGIAAVHVRTELAVDEAAAARLATCGVDVVSVDLHAETPATYRHMLGRDGFEATRAALERLATARRTHSDHAPAAALAVPWIVPRIRRCAASRDEIEPFYDRWQHGCGAVVIDAAPAGDPLAPARTPARVVERDARCTMTVLSDGSVPATPGDPATSVGRVGDRPLETLWAAVRAGRAAP